jgi:hypothetical protein
MRPSASLCRCATYSGRLSCAQILKAADSIGVGGFLCRILNTDFYEKALFVKVDVATALWLTQPLCPSRYASIRTFGELTLRWLGALWDPSFRATKEVLRSSERPSRRVGQVRMAQSPHIRSEALSRAKAVAIRRSLGSSPLWQCSSPPLRWSAPSPLCVPKLPPPALGADGRCGADRRPPL